MVKDKMNLMWGIEQMEKYLSKNHSPASNIMSICTEVEKQVSELLKLDKICPNRDICTLKYSCNYSIPHKENHECGLGHLSCAILLNKNYVGNYHCAPCIEDAQGRVTKSLVSSFNGVR